MVKITMSSDQSEPEDSETLAKAKEKLVIQQSLIDSSARTLQRLKESTMLMCATSTTPTPHVLNGITHCPNGEVQSAIDDDIKLQENKLMKGFSNQLVEKHRYIKHYLEEEEEEEKNSLEKIKREFDRLVNFQQFLTVAGLQPASKKALLEEEGGLTLDYLFNMLTPDLGQLLAKHSIPPLDIKKLFGALDLLSMYYEMWDRGEKPSVTAPTRPGSSASSRLNSISNLSAIDQDYRTDSTSSTGTSPLPLPLHPPTYTPTPLTPLSAQSLLLSPSSPFTAALYSSTPLNQTSNQTSHIVPVFASSPAPVVPNGGARFNNFPPAQGLIRSHSSSSNMLLEGDMEPQPVRILGRSHNSVSSLNSYNRLSKSPSTSSSSVLYYGRGQAATGGSSKVERKRKLPLTHKRSLSNPLANIILDDQDQEGNKKEQAPPQSSTHYPPVPPHRATVSGSSLARYSYRSPSPPSRAGSQPSISSNNVGSPKTYRHPQMTRVTSTTTTIATLDPSISQSVSSDQLISPSGNISGSESVLYYQNVRHGAPLSSLPQAPPPRCNSMAGMARSSYSHHQSGHSLPLNHHMDLTSSSMVDLPVGFYNGSTERLDQVEEYTLPNSVGKSRSVPRLTLISVSNENERGGVPSTSTPTSPRTPGTFTPTGHMRHTIMHRFTPKTYLTPHFCDFCKKSVNIAVRCKDCKYKCHKSCAAKAPPSCGLPQELMNFYRKQLALSSSMERLIDQRVEQPTILSPSEHKRPPVERSITYDLDTREPGFHIHDLSSEPTNTHYSPILEIKRMRAETVNGVLSSRHELSSQSSSTSLLEVPHARMPGSYRSSTSSTPSPPTSTPNSPRSPNEYRYSPRRSPDKAYDVKHGGSVGREEESDDASYDTESVYSSEYSSSNEVSDQTRVSVRDNTRGRRPGPQKIILAKSLPDLLRISPTEEDLDESCSRFLERPPERKPETVPKSSNRRVSVDSYRYRGSNNIKRKDSLQRTLSKASTLVASVPTEDDYDSDSYYGSQENMYLPDEQPLIEEGDDNSDNSDNNSNNEDIDELGKNYKRKRPLHRNSVVDEWNIPFEHIKMTDCIGKGRISKVYKGNWHGEVAIKHFPTPGATRSQVQKFKEEVSILKRTRHENLSLFMGACLLPPNLAIVTIFCKGPTLYKCIHVWSEPFHQEKSMDIAKQIAQAMGYLHARSIVHKNLNTRNIFLEKGKVVITDTGLSSISDNFWVNQKNDLVIRRPKLHYLAPELITTLAHHPTQENFVFSDLTDIYAFGTVFYELMIRRFPFSSDAHGFSFPPETLINLIGTGRMPDILTKETPARVRDLMYDCWHSRPERRLPFKTIHEALIKLSRKKTPITRSPSFPISLSKSTEGLDFLIP